MRLPALLACILALAAVGCGSPHSASLSLLGKHWDLRAPVFITVSPTMPHRDLVVQASRGAVSQAGGAVTLDSLVDQHLDVMDTDGGRCPEPGVLAYTPVPVTGTIYLCHSALVLATVTPPWLLDIMLHELGHTLANRWDHLSCESHAVMSPRTDCHPGQSTFTPLDKEYVCSSGATRGGPCA